LNQKAVRILLLDNIDSFTYNIYHYLEALGADVEVIDNQAIDPECLTAFDALVISPGPGLPREAGKLMEVLAKAVSEKIPTLGVCLGMQAIAEYFGGRIFNQQQVKHGQQAQITQTEKSMLFQGVPEQFQVGLYHSWAVDQNLPSKLIATAFSEDGIMMALEHSSLPVYGVQFHPESILSEYGKELFGNFLRQI
jgi:anthranilate synthase/aminodeoxychorismate synthase-like glutamine amidotransferase